MTRIFFTYIVPLLLPTLVYFLWMLPAWRQAKAEGRDAPPWEDAPWVWLFIAGVVFFGVSLVVFGVTDGASPDEQYAPPHMEDGRIVPGQFDGAGEEK